MQARNHTDVICISSDEEDEVLHRQRDRKRRRLNPGAPFETTDEHLDSTLSGTLTQDNCNDGKKDIGGCTASRSSSAEGSSTEIYLFTTQKYASSSKYVEDDNGELILESSTKDAVNSCADRLPCGSANIVDSATEVVWKDAEPVKMHSKERGDQRAQGKCTAGDEQDTEICYGMLCDVETLQHSCCDNSVQSQHLVWDGHTSLQDVRTNSAIAELSPRTNDILATLVNDANVSLQFLLQSTDIPTDHGKKPVRNSTSWAQRQSSTLLIILYGSLEMATPTGEWLSSINLLLQRPEHCDRNVRYMNPQCLAFEDEDPIMTFDLDALYNVQSDTIGQTHTPAFAELYTEVVYDESPQPAELKTQLHKHQKQALTFMLQRERGWTFDTDSTDIWKRHTDVHGVVRYRNRVSGHSQITPPKPFRGGVLADEMGLGKTCSMLSLIATNKLQDTDVDMNGNLQDLKTHIKATLIVVPFSLLAVWKTQIRRHLKPNTIRFCIYHGPARQSLNVASNIYDIVITTYNTVAYEWKRRRQSTRNNDVKSLFDFSWHRIVLDEAHVIRTRQTINSRSICALQAERRWCITGTPIQNRLSDLYSLLRFLKLDPYEEFKVFEEQILKPLRTYDDDALLKLQAIVKAITIRRPKNIISLPLSSERVEDVLFSDLERDIYENARDNVINVIESAMHDARASSSAYMNAFQRINDLRYICNHGKRPQRGHNKYTLGSQNDQVSFADRLDELLQSGGEVCVQCGTDLREESEGSRNALGLPESEAQDMGTMQLCAACVRDNKDNVPFSPSSPGSSSASTSGDETPAQQLSSKILALVQQLQHIAQSEKGAVFSYWTSTLDAVAAALTAANISHVYFHGSLSHTRRTQTLNTFATDSSIRVILVSITCGGQGLDLTAANHAFLLEPQWNPMLEEQAMSRVHRIGQTRPVSLVRFVVKNTWEEKIRVLQERKRSLADLVVDRRGMKGGEDGLKQLYFLKELVT